MLPDAQHEDEMFELVVTDQRRSGRYLITVNQHEVWLSYGQFQLLLELIKTRGKTRGRGYFKNPTIAYPAAVFRLRKSMDQALGEGIGKEVIETGVGSEYRLAPSVQVITEVETEMDKGPGGLGHSSSERLSAA